MKLYHLPLRRLIDEYLALFFWNLFSHSHIVTPKFWAVVRLRTFDGEFYGAASDADACRWEAVASENEVHMCVIWLIYG